MNQRIFQPTKSLWKGQLWNGSYFCKTIGSMSEENILRYCITGFRW
ncbi:MAG: transposase [Erysipelotrichaceae bacterium]|nr:transposase [Erysipelotrichaceae bacterium]